MTVEKILSIVDAVKKNSVSGELKCRWIADAEGRVLCEIHRLSADALPNICEYDYELSVPEPYCELYVFYAVAMLAFIGGKYDEYAAASEKYESAFASYAKYYIRTRK